MRAVRRGAVVSNVRVCAVAGRHEGRTTAGAVVVPVAFVRCLDDLEAVAQALVDQLEEDLLGRAVFVVLRC